MNALRSVVLAAALLLCACGPDPWVGNWAGTLNRSNTFASDSTCPTPGGPVYVTLVFTLKGSGYRGALALPGFSNPLVFNAAPSGDSLTIVGIGSDGAPDSDPRAVTRIDSVYFRPINGTLDTDITVADCGASLVGKLY